MFDGSSQGPGAPLRPVHLLGESVHGHFDKGDHDGLLVFEMIIEAALADVRTLSNLFDGGALNALFAEKGERCTQKIRPSPQSPSRGPVSSSATISEFAHK